MVSKNMLERFRLHGRTALITGGGSGIGRSYAHALGEMGAKVAVVDIDLERAREVANELGVKDIEAMALEADVRDEAQVKAMVDAVMDSWGVLTIGVNNAGIGVWRSALDMEYKEWRRIMALNLDAVFLCCREEARRMKEAGYGKIINTASMSGHIVNTPQDQSAYNTSKAGVLHLTRSLAAEFAPFGIRVNSISPGYTLTPLVEQFMKTEEGNRVLSECVKLTPMKRMATPEDLQGTLCLLASEVSDFMTGSDIVIDGGYCCW